MLIEGIKSLVRRSLAARGYRIERSRTSAHPLAFRIRRLGADDEPILRLAKAHLAESVMPAELPSLGKRWGATPRDCDPGSGRSRRSSS